MTTVSGQVQVFQLVALVHLHSIKTLHQLSPLVKDLKWLLKQLKARGTTNEKPFKWQCASGSLRLAPVNLPFAGEN